MTNAGHKQPKADPEGNQAQEDVSGSGQAGFSSANPPRAPSGLSTGLQPSGMTPGGGPGASVGSIGTGGGSDEDRPTGSVKHEGQ
jgi:hypothetical protein